jgi:hypothetical protein
MLDFREQIQSIYDFIKRSEEQQKYPYAYEIYLLTGVDETALTSRTSGTSSFNQDIENAVEKAKQAHGTLKVYVFGGKSPNARRLNTYTVNVSGLMNPPQPPLEKADVQIWVKEEVKKQNEENSTPGIGLGSLFGLVKDENARNDIEGLFGLFNALSGNNKEVERIGYQKQLDDFKFETRFNMLQEKYEKLSNENTELRVERDQFNNENQELKREKTDLEQRLAGYAPNELMKRVAIGVVSGIGTKILSNSPKTAELFGLSPEELKGALGLVEDYSEETQSIPETNVEISEVGTPQTPEEKQKATIIKNLSDALSTWELEDVAKIANIVGLCLDRAELINKTLMFLNQSMQGVQEESTEIDSQRE